MRFGRSHVELPIVPIYGVDYVLVDLGTATGLTYANNEFGGVQVTQGDRTERIEHIRTIVARRKPANPEQISNHEFRRRNKEEGERVRAGGEVELNYENVEAIGLQAYHMWGRSDANISFIRPVQDGNVSYPVEYLMMLQYLMRCQFGESFPGHFEGIKERPQIFLGVPHTADLEHLRLLDQMIRRQIKGEPVLVWENVASAFGARLADGSSLPYYGKKSVAIVDIGGGSMDIAILANSRVTHMNSSNTAGDEIDQAIQNFFRREKGLDIGFYTAIEIKHAIGSVMPFYARKEERTYRVQGSSFERLRPYEVEVTPAEIRGCITPVVDVIAGDLMRCVEDMHAQAEVQGDIFDNGFYLAGGQSKLHGLAEYLKSKLGLEMTCVANADKTVIDGEMVMKDNPDLLKLGQVQFAA